MTQRRAVSPSEGPSTRRPEGLSLRRRLSRGFTLVELFIVVVIIGVMATLATFGLSRYLRRSKTAEAVQMIGSIKAGQEAFFDETFRYYDVSESLDKLYPSTGDWDKKIQWGGGDTDLAARWANIGIAPEAPVQFRYACIAGPPTAMPTDATLGTGINYNLAAVATRPSHWYLVKAVADFDGDGVQSIFVGSSFSSEIYSQNAGE